MTPEGRIKARVNKRLAAYPAIWKFMPVQMGMGKPALDYLLCVPCGLHGRFVVIETKKPGGKMTALQESTAREMRRAGAKVFVVDDDATLDLAMRYIHTVYNPFEDANDDDRVRWNSIT